MLVPTTLAALPCCAAAITRIGAAATAASNATPWLTLFAISSPSDCARSRQSSTSTMTRDSAPSGVVRAQEFITGGTLESACPAAHRRRDRRRNDRLLLLLLTAPKWLASVSSRSPLR